MSSAREAIPDWMVRSILTTLPRGTIYYGWVPEGATCGASGCCDLLWPCPSFRVRMERWEFKSIKHSFAVPNKQPVAWVKEDDSPISSTADLVTVKTGHLWFLVPILEEQVLDALARISS